MRRISPFDPLSRRWTQSMEEQEAPFTPPPWPEAIVLKTGERFDVMSDQYAVVPHGLNFNHEGIDYLVPWGNVAMVTVNLEHLEQAFTEVVAAGS